MALNELDRLVLREERAARHEVETLRETITEYETRLAHARRQLARAIDIQHELTENLLARNISPA